MRDVHEVIAERKPTQYTTVLKQLQVMADKGLVERDESQTGSGADLHLVWAAR